MSRMRFPWQRDERKWRSINDLEESIRLKRGHIDTLALRKSVTIAVVDDEQFEPENNLRYNGYSFKLFQDLHSVSDIKAYPIVLCDLQGVGVRLNKDLQGAHLIKEIRKHYPEKFIIAYSGIAKNLAMARTAERNADSFVTAQLPRV